MAEVTRSEAGRLQGKVVVLTGGTSGIGKECVKFFAREGAHVVFSGRRDEKGEALMSCLKSDDILGEAIFVKGDVTVDKDVDKLFDLAVSRFGGVDMVVANAGIAGENLPVEVDTLANMDKVYDVNVKGVFRTCKAAVPAIEKKGGGYIFNIASIAAVKAIPGLWVYCSSKAAVNALTRCMAEEVKDRKIQVYSICPTVFESEMAMEAVNRLFAEGDMHSFAEHNNPSGKLGHGSELADIMTKIVEGKTEYPLGSNICVDGGGSHFPLDEYEARLAAAKAQKKEQVKVAPSV